MTIVIGTTNNTIILGEIADIASLNIPCAALRLLQGKESSSTRVLSRCSSACDGLGVGCGGLFKSRKREATPLALHLPEVTF